MCVSLFVLCYAGALVCLCACVFVVCVCLFGCVFVVFVRACLNFKFNASAVCVCVCVCVCLRVFVYQCGVSVVRLSAGLSVSLFGGLLNGQPLLVRLSDWLRTGCLSLSVCELCLVVCSRLSLLGVIVCLFGGSDCVLDVYGCVCLSFSLCVDLSFVCVCVCASGVGHFVNAFACCLAWCLRACVVCVSSPQMRGGAPRNKGGGRRADRCRACAG